MELILKNDFSEISPAADQVERHLAGHGAPAEALYVARLVLEELVSNIIKYGYDDNQPHKIHVATGLQDGTLVMEVSDDGHPFNPLDAPQPPLHLPAHERPIGGLGLHFIRSMTDSLIYKRSEGRNVVTIRKSCSM
jgi:anti-sigma regulatory factor (Ser/Thr protein kinase)